MNGLTLLYRDVLVKEHMHRNFFRAKRASLRMILINVIAVSLSSFSVHAEKRVALVIGNSSYEHVGQLRNAGNDADDISLALTKYKFDVVKGINLSKDGFRDILDEFTKKLGDADVALLFYAGHGMAVAGINYLIPVDAKLASAEDLVREAVSLEEIQLLMETRPRTNILIFDACRDAPFSRSTTRSAVRSGRNISPGWAPVRASKGTYISFATKPGEVASDGVGRNSPFTTALLKHMGTVGLDVQLMMRRVRKSVFATTRGGQLPWDRSSMIGEFFFAPPTRSGLSDQNEAWLSTERRRVRAGDEVQLVITPPMDCRLTLINVDNKGKSCLLFPHPDLSDVIFKAGQRTVFPPKDVRLRLDQPGEETFVALCNASPAAKQAAARRSRRIDCSVGPSDRVFNDYAFEIATLDFSANATSKHHSGGGKKAMLRSSVTISVTSE